MFTGKATPHLVIAGNDVGARRYRLSVAGNHYRAVLPRGQHRHRRLGGQDPAVRRHHRPTR